MQESFRKQYLITKMTTSLIVVATLLLALSACVKTNGILVHNVVEFETAVSNASAGDVIVLAKGVWNDAELNFKGEGTADQPIKLTVETKGEVFLEGQSNLRISGKYLEVSGLVFRNGYSPTGTVIAFREKGSNYAYHSRLTECVIDNFNGPERQDTESWLDIYGQNNQVDHCSFVNKRDRGVTLTVRLKDENCRNNNHKINNNYFAYRQSLGSNGGETMRLGTSHYSLSTSGTVVDNNYFDRCDGEVEIISNKSCGNQFTNNTFFECVGTLTFRHGHDNTAKNNFFLGNYKPNTGGIRIINERNKAINNYFYGVVGYRFRSVLVIMNGVPNSPINRYHQVKGGEFTNNTFIDCDNIQFCVGSDEERSAVPIDSKVNNNIFYHKDKQNIFTVFDDISGITFENNLLNKSIPANFNAGFKTKNIELAKNEFGYVFPTQDLNAGTSLSQPVATKENTGASWYIVPEQELVFGSGNKIKVKTGLNSLHDAVINSNSGDVLILEEGVYENSKKIAVNHPITIKGVNQKSTVLGEQSSMFVIENGGALQLIDLELSGKNSPDMTGNAIVSTSKYSMNRNYKLFVENCKVTDLKVNRAYNFLKSAKSTMADSVMFINTIFENVSGDILALNHETDDLGIYNAEHVDLINCSFKNVGGMVLSLYRGGRDESTVGPFLRIKNCEIDNCGNGSRNKSESSIAIHGIQNTIIANNTIRNSAMLNVHHTNGEPITVITDNGFSPKVNIVANSEDLTLKRNSIVK